MALFKKKTAKKGVVPASPPEEPETPAEIQEIAEMAAPTQVAPVAPIPVQEPTEEIRQIPVCLSQSQINNLVIENNIMLKQVVAEMED